MPVTDALPDMQRELAFFPCINGSPKKLTAEQIQQYNERGFISPLDVFTPEEATAIASTLMR